MDILFCLQTLYTLRYKFGDTYNKSIFLLIGIILIFSYVKIQIHYKTKVYQSGVIIYFVSPFCVAGA